MQSALISYSIASLPMPIRLDEGNRVDQKPPSAQSVSLKDALIHVYEKF